MLNKQKRIFIIHGWGGTPKMDWIPWLKLHLESKKYQVICPLMPDTDTPTIKAWVDKLEELIGKVDKNDILIGHSIGCQTILRYLEKLNNDVTKINKVILITPFTTLKNLSDEELIIAKQWLETPINFHKVSLKANSFISIFSDNDPWVPLKENRQIFKQKLHSEIITLHKKGHISENEGIKEFPEILNLI